MGISCYSGYVNKSKKMWVPSAEINSVFSLDNGEINHVFSYDIGNEKACGIIKICEAEDELFCFERNQYKYWKYNKKTRNITGKLFSSAKGYITSGVFENDYVWLFPYDFNSPISIVSLFDETVTELRWSDDAELSMNLAGTSMIKSYYYNGNIYLANRNENNVYLIKINCFARKITYKKLDNIKRINAVAASEQYVYVLCLNSNNKTVVRKYDITKHIIDEEIDVSEYVVIHNINSLEYVRMVYFNNSLLIFSIKSDEVIIVDSMKTISVLKDCEEIVVKNSCYDYQIIDDECFIFSLDSNGFYRILKNKDRFVYVNESIKFDEECYTNALKERCVKESMLVETDNIKLDSYIGGLV